ncbi:hypothetical protein CAPN001_20340 [Capnocytophaga stomatis]|uniref:hypothetical protein n=1 Tax=Capnocytophaga stomatis TaxID=1848904 RepID=UPI0019519832|nr:hypothetical protein [Capnocytophaga stomatis]GIJ97465.1 hypothetical protein CAPN001_20340 [Capnocytophaga stomatis]GIM49435.1 hypothetical protein CAPN003_08870 [Capnocytophaga stomatis]
MILSFQTKINGKPNNFVEKIIAGLYRNEIIDDKAGKSLVKDYFTFLKRPLPEMFFYQGKPKIHTIVVDKPNLWKAGKRISFFIHYGEKKEFWFAPIVPVIATQEIFMTHRAGVLEITVANSDSYIGGNDFYLDRDKISELAKNDGFDTVEEFSKYFVNLISENGDKTGNYWFKGKIIHWTNFKY